MRLNERGATLAIVLLVILVFSVLGIAVMGSVVNENKRVNVTESDVQARYLAESGLTYFETDFNNYVNNTDASSINLASFFNNYKSLKSVGESDTPAETQIKAAMDSNYNITVTSIGESGSIEKTLIGHYKLSYDEVIQQPSFDMMKFDKSGTIPIDFSTQGLVGLGLSDLLALNLLDFSVPGQTYYRVPADNKLLSINLLGLGINLGGDFETMKDYRVIATNDKGLLNLNLLNVATIDLLSYQNVGDLNVLINGDIPGVKLIILNTDTYRDIEFKKLAVMGNAIIQSSTSQPRKFTFDEGLYVNKSITIGGTSSRRGLTLQGNLVAMKDLDIKNVNFAFNNNLYVWGNATITNSLINSSNPQNRLCLLADGSITINNNDANNKYYGIFYSQSGSITINTYGKPMTIYGGIIGSYHVDNANMLKIVPDPQYLTKLNLKNLKLVPQGRTFQ